MPLDSSVFIFGSPCHIHNLENNFQAREARGAETLQIQHFCENCFFQTQNGSSHPTPLESQLPRSISPRQPKIWAFAQWRFQQSSQPGHFQCAFWRDVGVSCSLPLPSRGVWPQVLVQGFEGFHWKTGEQTFWGPSWRSCIYMAKASEADSVDLSKCKSTTFTLLFWIAEVQETEKKSIETCIGILVLQLRAVFSMSKFKFYHCYNGKYLFYDEKSIFWF